jgi:type I restriction enzyme, S subunit
MTQPPVGWQSASLGEVCRIASGATPKTATHEYWGGDIAWITPDDMSKDRSQTLLAGARSLTTAGYESCSARLFPAGSVIYSSRAPIGYVAIAGSEMCTNQGCKTAVPPDYLNSRYLYHYLRWITPDIESRASGTTFKEISGKRFAETELIWPTLDEQRRIVTTLEDHLSRLDAASAGLTISGFRLSRFAERLLERLIDPESLGASDLEPIGNLIEAGRKIAYGVLIPGPHTDDGIPLVRVGDIRRGRVDSSALKRVAPEVVEKYPRTMLRGGELLLTLVGTIGRVGVVPDELVGANVARAVGVLPLSGKVEARFLAYALQAPSLQRDLIGRAHEVARKTLNLEDVRRFVVPVPTMDTQWRIVREMDAQMSMLNETEGAIRMAERRSLGLRRSLLAAAFTGRLTGSTNASDIEELSGV